MQPGIERRILSGALLLAVAALAFLIWLIFVAFPARGAPDWVSLLPLGDAMCNAASAVCAVAGFVSIRSGKRAWHRGLMVAALSCSAAFLAGYVVYHHFHGETRFVGPGWIRPIYWILLASHVLLSTLVLPLLLATVGLAGFGFFERHKRLARWTLPLWLYVSVSGVAVYVFLEISGSY
jgi:putative membrane protein